MKKAKLKFYIIFLVLISTGCRNEIAEVAPVSIQFEPNWEEIGIPFRHTWEGLGNVDQFRWMVRSDMQEQLAMAQKELNMKHVRAVGIFDEEMRVFALDPATWRTPTEERKPHYNWQVIDYIIQSLLDKGLNPMITTTFTPYLMASGEQYCFSTKSNVTPPKDYAQWTDLITKTLEHFVEHFGLETVKGWYFEVWNEPNLDAFWQGADKEEYFKLWNVTYKAIKSVDKNFRIGGPSAARAEWIGDFIEYGRSNKCEPDYIITHVYNNDSPFAALSPFAGPQTNKINDSPNFLSGVVKGVSLLLDSLNFKGEVHFNEWGRSWFPSDDVRETPNEAAYIVKTMAEVSQYADYFAYWCLSDIYDQLGYVSSAFSGTYGMLNIHGLKKPAYKAHEMLGRLGDIKVNIKDEGADVMNNAIATKSDKGYQFLYYSMDNNYHDGMEVGTKMISISLPKGVSNSKVKVYQLNNIENNILSAWKKMGSPAYLKKEQVAELKKGNELVPSINTYKFIKSAKGNLLQIVTEIPGVILIEVEK